MTYVSRAQHSNFCGDFHHFGSIFALSSDLGKQVDRSGLEKLILDQQVEAAFNYACLLAGSIGHRPRNATVVCLSPPSPSLS